MLYQSSLLFWGLFSLASALAVNNVPVATPISNSEPSLGVSPTPAPAVEELRRRQATKVIQETVLAAPDNTCGYFGGSSDLPWGCTSGNCVFAAPTPTAAANSTSSSPANVLCCDPTSGCPAAPAPTACVGNAPNEFNTSCTGSCPSDPMTLKCTSGIYIFCNTVTFTSPDVSALFCNYRSTDAPLTAETSFFGQVGHSFTPSVAHFATTTAPTTTAPTTLLSSKASTEFSSTGTSSATATAVSGGGAKKALNKRAIIGGTIGGVLGLALILGAVIVFLRWRNVPEPFQGQGKAAASSSEEVGEPVAGETETVVNAGAK